jgi:hypothetical protein
MGTSVLLDVTVTSTDVPLKFEYIAVNAYPHSVLAVIKDDKQRKHAVSKQKYTKLIVVRLELPLMSTIIERLHNLPMLTYCKKSSKKPNKFSTTLNVNLYKSHQTVLPTK